MEIPDGKSRFGWFDAMRGLAIILVILRHIVLGGFGLEDEDSVLRSVIVTFNTPLFFFISGFFAYRVCESWTPPPAWVHNGFGGYWFTIVLFQMFVVFPVLSLLSKLFKSEHVLEVGLILIPIVSIVVVAVPLHVDSKLWKVLGMGKFCLFFPVLRIWDFLPKVSRAFRNDTLQKLVQGGNHNLCRCLHSSVFPRRFRGFCRPLARFIHVLGSPYVLLLLVVAFFFTKREFFETQNATTSCLRHVGRRTLDIYMIHYFFLPDLSALREWLLPGNMFIVQLAIGLVVSALIIAACLLLGEVMRMSNFLSAWLFGVKI